MIRELVGKDYDMMRLSEDLETVKVNARAAHSSIYQMSVTVPASVIKDYDAADFPQWYGVCPFGFVAGTNWDTDKKGPFVDEAEFDTISPHFAGTVFEEIWRDLSRSYKIGRVRILGLAPKTTYSWHRDPEEKRLHVPIRTNEGAFFLWQEANRVCVGRMPIVGQAYLFETNMKHTAVNSSMLEDRFHLVLNVI